MAGFRTLMAGAGDDQTPLARLRISERNSLRVSCSSRKQPNMEDVTAAECCFSTPRIIMQRWRASITTPTPAAGWFFESSLRSAWSAVPEFVGGAQRCQSGEESCLNQSPFRWEYKRCALCRKMAACDVRKG